VEFKQQSALGIHCGFYTKKQRSRKKQTTKLDSKAQSLFEKLTVAQLVKKFPAIYGTPWFITVFTRVCHWNLS
jgi:hypothetical protein